MRGIGGRAGAFVCYFLTSLCFALSAYCRWGNLLLREQGVECQEQYFGKAGVAGWRSWGKSKNVLWMNI